MYKYMYIKYLNIYIYIYITIQNVNMFLVIIFQKESTLKWSDITCVYIIKCIIVVLSLFFVVVGWYVLSNEERSSHSH